MFMYFTYFYTRLRQSIRFFGSATNWAIAQLGNRFNFPTGRKKEPLTQPEPYFIANTADLKVPQGLQKLSILQWAGK